MTKERDIRLDAEERELSDSFDRGEWTTVKNLQQEKALARMAAQNTLQKDQYAAGHPDK